MKQIKFKAFKTTLILGSVPIFAFSVAGCKDKHEDSKPKPKPKLAPISEIKQTELTKATLIIPKVLKKYSKEHPFRYEWQTKWKETWGCDFDSQEAKILFTDWFFPSVPNKLIKFERSEDLCFLKGMIQKVYACYDLQKGKFTQAIQFYLLSK